MDLTLLFTDWTSFIFIAFSLITLIQLYYYWGLFSKLAFFKKYEKEKSQQHPVSVIVCARDEAGNLAKNLPGLLVQQYPSTHEIIVVNHNSQDDTRYLLDEFKKTFKGLHAVNLEQEAIGIPGKKYPLSIGIKEAKYEILLLTDADCVPASENWLQLMQEGYDEGIEVVLGYGSYNKKPGLLNKLIRFETFHSGLQYLSYAAAGMPYMGVGRNLSYKKTLFFNNKGFSSINHLPGGDDDLFINKVATKNNTRIVIDPEAFTLSEPAKNFGNWFRQKTRHYSTARYYKGLHKFLLGMYNVSFFLFYPLFVASILLFDWRLALGVFALRFISQAIIFNKTMKKLQEQDLFSLWWFFDLWMFIYYCIFAPALWKRPNNHWT
ncbi:MAG: glycosyltransferase [Chitinophagaceae bacterium]|uniref:glycosyltransferase n=1 Tax=unclassified Paraflavitalea TaxID=2798305 RepID=UPI003D3344BB|nr:glycosyltransferase [Chitinophagaceae bacterium]